MILEDPNCDILPSPFFLSDPERTDIWIEKHSHVFLPFATCRLFRKLVQQSYLLFLSDCSPSGERFPS